MHANNDGTILSTDARVNITWQGQNGDLFDPVDFNASDARIRQQVAEALRNGQVAGVNAHRFVDLSDFVVDRFPASGQVPYPRIFLRPRTPFG